jgi:hypothetical protein
LKRLREETFIKLETNGRGVENRAWWKLETYGKFSCKSFYSFLMRSPSAETYIKPI